MTTLRRRGLLGLVATLPLALRTPPAAAARLRAATLTLVGSEGVLGLAAPGSGHLGVTPAPPTALCPTPSTAYGRQSASNDPPAPWGWDTLENVR